MPMLERIRDRQKLRFPLVTRCDIFYADDRLRVEIGVDNHNKPQAKRTAVEVFSKMVKATRLGVAGVLEETIDPGRHYPRQHTYYAKDGARDAYVAQVRDAWTSEPFTPSGGGRPKRRSRFPAAAHGSAVETE